MKTRMMSGVNDAVRGDGVLEELLGLADLLRLGQVHRVTDTVEEPEGSLGHGLPGHVVRDEVHVLLGDDQRRHLAPVHELQLLGQQGDVDPVPLEDEARPVPPVHAHLLERLPQSRSRK